MAPVQYWRQPLHCLGYRWTSGSNQLHPPPLSAPPTPSSNPITLICPVLLFFWTDPSTAPPRSHYTARSRSALSSNTSIDLRRLSDTQVRERIWPPGRKHSIFWSCYPLHSTLYSFDHYNFPQHTINTRWIFSPFLHWVVFIYGLLHTKRLKANASLKRPGVPSSVQCVSTRNFTYWSNMRHDHGMQELIN